jgi:hypothetical protein
MHEIIANAADESITHASMHFIIPERFSVHLSELRVPHESSAATHDFQR